MLGNGNPLSRPGCTSLTPAIDIKNGKVGINKRLGTDGNADAGVYNLDVNGSVNASTLCASSIEVGDLIAGSIAHNGDGLYIGDPDNSSYVNIVEDMKAGNGN